MRSHRLAGGGFDLFFDVQEKIDAILDAVDPDDEAAVDRAVVDIKAEFARFPWIPTTIRALLDGKNHLPDNKLRLNLLNPKTGFFGDGSYREHFFGEATPVELLARAGQDQLRYSVPALKNRRRRRARLAWQSASERRHV